MSKIRTMDRKKIVIEINEAGQIASTTSAQVVIGNSGPLEITVKKNSFVEIEVHLAKPVALHYVFEPFSDVRLVELRQFKQGGLFIHEMDVLDNSRVLGLMLNEGDHENDLEIEETCHMQRDAVLEISYGELSDGSTVAHYTYELDGSGAQAHLHVAAIARNQDAKYYQVTLNHHAPATFGLMENYGVTRDDSRLTFDGVGRIDKGMHQSDSHQTSRIMVFDPHCIARANPYLFIDDYDVKASHAASVGAMNEEHLYYLQSRGLTKKQAMHLITMGYLLPAVNVLKDEALQQRFEDLLMRKVGDE